jgi:hypothetical protein
MPHIVKNGNKYIIQYIEQNSVFGDENTFKITFTQKGETVKIKLLQRIQYKCCKIFIFSEWYSGTNKLRFFGIWYK